MDYIKIFKHNLWQLIICLDQLAGVVLGLVTFTIAWADETISSKAYRKSNNSKMWKYAEICINTLFFFDYEKEIKEEVVNGVIEYKNIKIKHCQLCYLNEKERGHLAPEFRTHQ